VAKRLEDTFYGCLIGGAIGDALGAPVEGLNYWEIREQYGTLTDLIASPRHNTNQLPGGISDDTALRQYIALAIVRKNGRIRPEDLAAVWLEKGNAARFWSNKKAVWEKLRWGANPWDTGRGALQCATASMAIAPVGLINAGDPAQAYLDGFILAGINQDGEERDAAASLSAGIAAACLPTATPQTVQQAIIDNSTFHMQRAIELTMDAAAPCSSTEEFTERYYIEFTDWTMPRPPHKVKTVPPPYPQRNRYYSGSSFEIIPVALALLNFCDWDVNRSIIAAANFGRDCDTIATIAGGLAGALYGTHGINPDWITVCEHANADLFESLEGDASLNFHAMAQRLVRAFHNTAAAVSARMSTIEQIIGGENAG
jgi:ADP-ribosylglycohydrolase